MPEIRRLNYTEHAERAAPRSADDPGYAGAVAAQAVRLAPLQAIQVAFDQTQVRAEALARGEPWPYTGGSYREHADATLAHARRHRDILRTAADAADTLIAEFGKTLSSVQEPNMSGQNPDEGPQLTVGGEPHPLEQGGYDPNADPARPASESDVAALKAGHATPAQAEALAEADVRASEQRQADQERQAAQQPQRQQPQPQQAPGAPAPPQRAPGPGQPGGPTPPGQAPRPADPKQTPKR
jgi:hypothetical protein